MPLAIGNAIGIPFGGKPAFNPASIRDANGVQLLKQQLFKSQKATIDGVILDERSNKGDARPIQLGRCYNFDGVNDDIAMLQNGLDINFQNGFSFSFWAEPSVLNNDHILMRLDNSSNVEQMLVYHNQSVGINPISIYGPAFNGGNPINSSNGAFQVGVMKHYFISYNFGTQTYRVYINGVLTNTVTSINTTLTTLTNVRVRFGSRFGAQFYGGKLFDIRFWNTDMSSSAGNVFRGESAGTPLIWYKGDEQVGGYAYNSGNSPLDGVIGNATLSSFHSTQSRISFQNNIGYSNYCDLDANTNADINFTTPIILPTTGWRVDMSVLNNRLISDNGLIGEGSGGQQGIYISNNSSITFTDGVNFPNFGISGLPFGVTQRLSLRNDGTTLSLFNTTTGSDVLMGSVAKGALGNITCPKIGTGRGRFMLGIIADVNINTSGNNTNWTNRYLGYGISNTNWLDLVGTNHGIVGSASRLIFLPRSEINTTQDIFGNNLQFKGDVPYNGRLLQSNSLFFNGVNQIIDYGTNPLFQISTSDYSVRTIINYDSSNNQQDIYSNNSQISGGILVMFITNKVRFHQWTSSGLQLFDSVTTLVNGVTYNIECRKVGNVLSIFINNVFDSSLTMAGTITAGPNNAIFGNRTSGGSNPIKGNVRYLNVTNLTTSTVIIDSTFAEGSGTIAYNKAQPTLNGTLVNGVVSGLQNSYHANLVNGFSLYTHDTLPVLRVPYGLDNLPLPITPPSGYTKAKDCPAGAWHNDAESQIDFSGGVLSPVDIQGNWENAWTAFANRTNPLFKSVKQIETGAIGAYNFLAFSEVLTGSNLDKIEAFEGVYAFENTKDGLTALYSFDPLLKSATGLFPIVRVRRAGDNAEQDFTSAQTYSGNMTAWVVAGGGTQHGFVVNWYDQSGNNRTVAQPITTNQFQIVISGVLNTEGTKNRAGLLGLDIESNNSTLVRHLIGNLPANFGLGDITIVAVAKKNANRTYASVVHLNGFVSSGGVNAGTYALQSTATTTAIGVHNSWVAATQNSVDMGVNSTRHFVASTRRTGGVSGNGGMSDIRVITTQTGLRVGGGTQTWTSGNGGNLFTIGTQGGNTGTVWGWSEDIQCVALYNRALSDTELNNLLARLEDTYGI